MQEKIKTGDALLSEDTQYVTSVGSRVVFRGDISKSRNIKGAVYLAHPSASLPRFLVPSHDRYALKFITSVISTDHGIKGTLLRALFHIPGGATLVRLLVFSECIVVEP